jgi:DNA polymerase family A
MAYFSQVVVCDFEYQVEPGGLPDVLCMIAYVLDEHLQHVRTIRMWRGEFGKFTPFDIGRDTLFVAYSAWAELTVFMTLGWRFPKHIFDLHTAYLSVSNVLLPYEPELPRAKPSKRLPDACRAFGIEGWERIEKETMAQDIGEGRWEQYGKQAVLNYCEEDVRKSVELLRAMLHPNRNTLQVDVQRVMFWSDYSAKAIAQIQAQGMPIDMELWNLVQENKTAIIHALLQKYDPSFGTPYQIYSMDGEWSYESFERWLVHEGIHAWPRLQSGRLDIDGDAFRMMYSYHKPKIENLHMLRDSLGVIVRAKLPIGPDGRNRPSVFPFGTATGRNAHAKSLYNAHASMRSFMRFPAGKIGVYLDWKAQEIGVAAAKSRDLLLQEAYKGDVYHALARIANRTHDPDCVHWKKTEPDERQKMKALQLGINYGMTVKSLAQSLDVHPSVASAIVQRHKQVYAPFWKWRAEEVERAMLERRIESVFGWPLHLSHSPNKRTLYNFPMQSGGAEMLRLAAVRSCEAGLVPIMLVHDAMLFEFDNEEQIEHAKEIMRHAGRDVCDGFAIDVEEDIKIVGGGNYKDKRKKAQEMWQTIMDTLELIGAVPKKALL